MTVITQIEPTKLGLYAIFSSEGYLFSIDDKAMEQCGLQEGSSLSDEELSCIESKSDTWKAKERGMRLIARRAHGAGELRDKLLRQHDIYSADKVVQYLLELELLDDKSFARMRAEYLAENGKSLREIRDRLYQAGVSRNDIDEALESLDLDETEIAESVMRKAYATKLEMGEWEKVFAAMARRGFQHESVKKAARRIEER